MKETQDANANKAIFWDCSLSKTFFLKHLEGFVIKIKV